ncbi:hypothetical protein Btru_036544 [Bulinus truncatus]|nr:hypothetical protein Btru_036544 [Bulinus truncatus]
MVAMCKAEGPYSDRPTNDVSPYSDRPTNDVGPYSDRPTNDVSPYSDRPTNDVSPYSDRPTNDVSPYRYILVLLLRQAKLFSLTKLHHRMMVAVFLSRDIDGDGVRLCHVVNRVWDQRMVIWTDHLTGMGNERKTIAMENTQRSLVKPEVVKLKLLAAITTASWD